MSKKPVRCDQHKDRDTIPATCSVCQRLAMEQDIVTRTIDALLTAGYRLQTDIREEARPAAPTRSRAAILREMLRVRE